MTSQLGNLGRLALMLACMIGLAGPVQAGDGQSSRGGNGGASSGSGSAGFRKLDRVLASRAKEGRRRDIRVIIELANPSEVRGLRGVDDGEDAVRQAKGRLGRRLRAFNGRVAYVSEKELEKLASHPLVKSVHVDRPTKGHLNRTAVTIGARYDPVRLWL